MAGRIKGLIDLILEQRAKGDPFLIDTTTAKLIFKGVNPERFTSTSPDDPSVEARIKAIAAELGVSL
ncbi:MAG TPA: hypothetical protein VLW84_08325 [Terriglobales bacterium]|nr:hypothetical protein [Terriglobales bacterium]